MDGGWNEAEQFVFVAANKKLQWLGVAHVYLVGGIAGRGFRARHDEMEMRQAWPKWRMKPVIGVEMIVIARRDESREK